MKLLPKSITSTEQINEMIKFVELQQLNYLGCFPRNMIPKKTNKLDCFVFNNKNTIGEHWLACVHANDGILYVYDSFGRTKKYFGLGSGFEMSNDNKEQKITEDNCGARSVAWLKCCDVFSPEIVEKVI